jgi:hypothetical protein
VAVTSLAPSTTLARTRAARPGPSAPASPAC